MWVQEAITVDVPEGRTSPGQMPVPSPKSTLAPKPFWASATALGSENDATSPVNVAPSATVTTGWDAAGVIVAAAEACGTTAAVPRATDARMTAAAVLMSRFGLRDNTFPP